ncbi:electron transport complex subunit RsxC [Clostridium sp. CF011]|uniref:electron transport complex subunit RsxC n=1 Tax=unclassified Clostridium TaxID=2614128 RepID=UPI001C0B8071|nr:MULTISPECIES: electron transport complex subunit RsxC [unclassified Clostridium]MBU3090952.1 electron transport complex subunit RsxC [Clostridium sp. CF011]MBW9144482.1 electron transport complex subunit RsxC [Clostridium sp. CM027]UVE40745.1 electron transport complex subunit RsxC [Clostridium sp. CM027]WAG69716.1 electron transport complex subunit RsxC [Clostridium sp. CF011]
MGLLTFKKGIHPSGSKDLSMHKAIQDLLPKGNLVFPMQQHIGAPCEPLVKKGDKVLVGQKIGESKAFVSAPIYSSVSGTVKDVAPWLHSNGTMVLSAIIENDNTYEEVLTMTPHNDYEKLSKNEIVTIIKEAGIVGMGGACFPTHIKLTPPEGKIIDSIIINAAECEPYLTCDYRMMMEKSTEIALGLKIILQMFPGVKGYVGIEDNKPDAIEAMKKACKSMDNVQVTPLITKYPQGAEKQLIYAITGRELPSGKLPADVGCIVQNVDSVFEIYNAVVNGRPLMERVLTVTGEAVKEPLNLRVKFGTSIEEVIEAAGGFKEDPVKVISGGPMMGMALSSLKTPVIKGTSGILCLTKQQAKLEQESSCIRCGKCMNACPMFLNPTKLNSLVLRGKYDEFEEYHGMDCIECACCSYVCPAKRHLTQTCREGKQTVNINRRKK